MTKSHILTIIAFFVAFGCPAAITDEQLARIDELRLLSDSYCRLTDDDINFITTSGLFDHGQQLAEYICQKDKYAEPREIILMTSDICDLLRRNNLTHTESYRWALFSKANCLPFYYKYEELDAALDSLQDNIAQYVPAGDMQNAWNLLARYPRVEYTSARKEWQSIRIGCHISRMLDSAPRLTAEMEMSLISLLMSDVISGTAYVPSDRIDKYALRLRAITRESQPRSAELIGASSNVLEMAAIATDPESTSLRRYMLRRHLKDDPMNLIMRCSLLFSLGYIHTIFPDELYTGREIIEQAIGITDTIIARENGVPSIVLSGRVKQQLSLMMIDTRNVTERQQDTTDADIYNQVTAGFSPDCYSQRALADIVETFTLNRQGQTSSLPFNKVAEDYLNAVSSDSYLPYRIGSIVNASMFICNSGDTERAMQMLDSDAIGYDTLPAAQRIHVLRQRSNIYQTRNDVTNAIACEEQALELASAEPDESFDILQLLLNLYNNSGRHDDAKSCIDRLRALRPTQPYDPWVCAADWDIACYEAMNLPTVEQRINAFKKLERTAYQQANAIAQYNSCRWLATQYKTLGDNKAYRESLETAVALLDYTGNPLDLDLCTEYLSFLYNTENDRVTWRSMLTTFMNIAQLQHLDISIPYLRFLSLQFMNTCNSGILDDSAMLMSAFMTSCQTLGMQCKDDPFSKYLVSMEVARVASTFITNTQAGNNVSEGVEQTVLDCFGIVLDNFLKYNPDSHADYLSWGVAMVNTLYGLHRYDDADALLSQLGNYADDHQLSDVLDGYAFSHRLRMATYNKDYAMMERLLTSDTYKTILANGDLNVESQSHTMSLLSQAYAHNGRTAEALDLARQRFGLVSDFVDRQFFDLSEAQRTALTENGVATAVDIYTILPNGSTPEGCTLAYDATLYYRNLLLESSNTLRRAVIATNDSTLLADYTRLMTMRQQIAADAAVTNSSTITPEDQRVWSDRYQSMRELEDSISAAVGSLTEGRTRRHVHHSDVARALNKDEAAIEFIFDGTCYGALVSRRGKKAPEYIRLASDSLLNEWLRPMQNTNINIEKRVRRVYSRGNGNGVELYEGIWQPLEPHLQGVTTVYYTPTARLAEVAMAALTDDSGQPICCRYDLQQLSSTARLASRKKKSRKDMPTRAIAMGDVYYDDGPTRSATVGPDWKHLEQTVLEVAHFDSICTAHGLPAKLLVQEAPTERAFRAMSGKSPDLLLMATHGFYVTRDAASAGTFYVNKGLTDITSADTRCRNIPPLQRGGLVLAGGNAVWRNEAVRNDDSDGILTAAEVSQLDLSGTKLLVLSACETGLGEHTFTEGVNGLQRGFKLAGVQSMILSLWQVGDTAGRRFMAEFYDKLFTTGDAHAAYRHALLTMQKTYPTSPQKWAPFIMLD